MAFLLDYSAKYIIYFLSPQGRYHDFKIFRMEFSFGCLLLLVSSLTHC